MPRNETVVLTNMCMVYDNQGNVLVEDRLDPSWPGICFPGGHVEPGESFTRAVIREVWEERTDHPETQTVRSEAVSGGR
nr:NUDIX domain-containing protein [uncultured Acetatifactor sp.]